jgi:hypothetical protein
VSYSVSVVIVSPDGPCLPPTGYLVEDDGEREANTTSFAETHRFLFFHPSSSLFLIFAKPSQSLLLTASQIHHPCGSLCQPHRAKPSAAVSRFDDKYFCRDHSCASTVGLRLAGTAFRRLHRTFGMFCRVPDMPPRPLTGSKPAASIRRDSDNSLTSARSIQPSVSSSLVPGSTLLILRSMRQTCSVIAVSSSNNPLLSQHLHTSVPLPHLFFGRHHLATHIHPRSTCAECRHR